MARARAVQLGKRIWTLRLPDAKHALLPPSTTRPNPLVAGDRVFASIFAPGSVCAADRRTGNLIWRRNLDGLAGDSVVLAGDLLLAKSARTLYALAPETGEVRWTFTPRSEKGEWMYSDPAVGRGRVFIGDRMGDFHCVDLGNGKAIWRRRTSGARNNQANATALVAGSRVVMANNAGAVVCYEAANGKTLWRQTVDGSCLGELQAAGSNVLIGARSLYVLNVRTGTIKHRCHYPDKRVASVAVSKSHIVAVYGRDFHLQDTGAPSAGYELAVFARGREIVRRPLKAHMDVRTCPISGLVYGAGVYFFCAINPCTREEVWSSKRYTGLPDRSGEVLYALTHDGVLSASRIKSYPTHRGAAAK